MAFISKSSAIQMPASAVADERDEILYQNERTQVFRRHLEDGTGSLICKQPLGPKALMRLRHERRILERLAGVKGVQQPSSRTPAAASLPPGVIAFEDGDYVSLADAAQAKRFDLPALLALMLQLADIIAAVHRAGVVHKDISPANILLQGSQQQPLLIDFDLATTFAEERPGFIQPQEIAGTLAYIAPEQTGRTGRSVDQRADLYALGALFYELAVGHPPFDNNYADQLQLIHDILARAPKAPAEIDLRLPKALSDIILHLLEKEPDRRYQSAEGLKIDLLRLREMLARGENGSFPLGERDYPLRLLPPSQLVGRAVEIGILNTAFDNALHGRGSGLLVSGAPGVGKSALINELRPIVTARRGWFVAGKFDQYRQDIGAGAMGQAMHALIRLMLAEPEAELAVLRERVLQGLGSNAGLLAAMLPELGASFGITAEAATGDPIQTLKRLVQASLDLLRALASPQRPLVMVIDDLQWSTATPLDFIDAIITDDSLRGLLLVGSYRESEVDATHPLSTLLARWERLGVAPQQLRLNNLPPDDLASLLGEMLRLPPAQAQQLAQAVGARTGGNPFDTVELVNALRHDGVLIPGADGWHWEAATIRRHIGKGEVIDLLTARIARLPPPARALLETMACLGGEVELGRLAAAGGLSIAEAEEQLAASLEEGLLVMEDTDKIRFRHDRVQQAAYNGLSPAARNTLHLLLARRMAVAPEFAGMAAEQYLSALDAITDNEERRRVADLLHVAATQARGAANHMFAERCLTAALALLNTAQARNQTAADYTLSAALEIELHAVLYCLGRLDAADGVYRSIEGCGGDLLALAEAACIQISSLSSRGRQGEALTLGLQLLRRLGLPNPEEDIHAEVERRLDGLYRWAKEDAQVDEQHRREAHDPGVLAAAKLLNRLVQPAFFSEPVVMAWLLLETQRLWAEHGCCASMMGTLTTATPITICLRQDYRAGYSIVRHVLTVSEAHGYEPETSHVRHIFVFASEHWFEPLENTIPDAQRAREGLLLGGMLTSVCLSYYPTIAALLDSAPMLDDCASEVESGLAFAARTGNDHSSGVFLSYRQLLRLLRGETDGPRSFNDGGFDEAAHLADLGANRLAVGYYHIHRALGAALFGDTASLAQHAAAAMPLLPYISGFYVSALAHLLQALALTERIRTAGAAERDGLLVEFAACRDWLAARAADAPMNFLHLLKWIDAERAWATNDRLGALAGFDAALVEAASRQRPWHRALMTERAGLCHLAQGMAHTGQSLLMEAWRLYQAWGAGAKAKAMTTTHNFLRAVPALRRKGDSSSHGGSHSGSISVDSIDLVGVLRASQALSSETSFARLRLRMSELLQEMTGATDIRGVLWHEESQEWCMPPPQSEGENGKPIPVEEAGQRRLLPLSAFNYVVRTREPLLVDDALHDDRFAHDPYFAGIERCSLLGVPVFNQGALRLVLLLENRLSHGAFSADRLEAVNLIAGQLVISIDNVQLYASLERKVAERTQALEAANERLAALSTTDALTGLANRRHFNEVFEAEWQRAVRPQHSLGVAMIDIDQFKLYNDHYGHQGGDECLRKVAATLGASIRGDTDLVARYGGEEFIMVLPHADLTATHVVAERARVAVEALNEAHENAGHGIVTISVGIAALVPTEESESEHLIELADAALYRAKKNGRNQVVGWREN